VRHEREEGQEVEDAQTAFFEILIVYLPSNPAVQVL
jgi:hypothetical protein